ncbi:MAG: hypothetical protein ACREPT_11475, partial [Rudaea sp.]
MSDSPQIAAAKAAFNQTLTQAVIAGSALDFLAGTNYAMQVSNIISENSSALAPPIAPPAPAPEYTAMGFSFAAQPGGFRRMKAADDFRAQLLASDSKWDAMIANNTYPVWAVFRSFWAHQDMLIDPELTLDIFPQADRDNIARNVDIARSRLEGPAGSASFSDFSLAFAIAQTPAGWFQFDETKPIADTGAFSGDLVVGGKVLWTGVHLKDMAALFAAYEATKVRS